MSEDGIDELFEESIILPTQFKDYCIEMDIIQEWYNFRDKRYKEIAISWCKQN